MKGSLIIVGFFILGIAAGLSGMVPESIIDGDLYTEQEQKQPDQYRNGLGRPRTVTLSQKRSDDDTAQHETYDSKHIPTILSDFERYQTY